MSSSSGSVAEIKSKIGVLEVVGETVVLKRAGATYKGLCPFHGEKTPSFVVTPDRETWHCFGCGEHGDIFTFLMRRDGLDFREALTRLAERAGVEQTLLDLADLGPFKGALACFDLIVGEIAEHDAAGTFAAEC